MQAPYDDVGDIDMRDYVEINWGDDGKITSYIRCCDFPEPKGIVAVTTPPKVWWQGEVKKHFAKYKGDRAFLTSYFEQVPIFRHLESSGLKYPKPEGDMENWVEQAIEVWTQDVEIAHKQKAAQRLNTLKRMSEGECLNACTSPLAYLTVNILGCQTWPPRTDTDISKP